MKFLALSLLCLVAVACARHITLEDVIDLEKNSAYGYIDRIGVPLAEKVRKAEEEAQRNPSRIAGGSFAFLGQFPYQVGILTELPTRISIASAVLVSPTRVLTAAHNLQDGILFITRITVVLGSVTIFTGGTRIVSTNFVLHENWTPSLILNDVAMINLPSAVSTSSIIAPIALPSGDQLNDDFAGDTAIVSGYGITPISSVNANQQLSFVDVPVMTNVECALVYGSTIQPSTICTSAADNKGICSGDSGGPLAVFRNNSPLLSVRSDNMKFLALFLLCLVAVACARHITLEDVIDLERNSAYGYIDRIGVPLAEKVRKAEEEAQRNPSRIAGGSFAFLGQFPYQVGLLVELPTRLSLSSAVLVSPTRVLTAAHNLEDGIAFVTRITAVLGSVTIFTGGTRVVTTNFVLHENWTPSLILNDVAMINLPSAVSTSSILAPIALPSGDQLNEDFAGDIAIVSGYGITPTSSVTANQQLSFVDVPVMTNAECALVYGSTIQPSNICASGAGNRGICSGDSGGPLAVVRNNSPLLVGITSFASWCGSSSPSGFARVTYFMSWINRHL
uniref:Peptidase S1 domain-containing protein n=1 Tax=Heliothis virescens TaxID=7102 RepID=A0A2A4JTB0_HELVI